MGYERYGREDGRFGYEDRQPRQDYDRSFGSRADGAGDNSRDDGRGPRQEYGRDRQDYPRAERNRFADPRGDDRASRFGRDDHGRQPQGYDYENRGFMDRAGDEVRSWFGDEDAERRRRLDDRYAEREDRRDTERRYAGGTGFGETYYSDARNSGAGGFGRSAGEDRQGAGHDPHYRSWRDRQVAQFDRDYEDYQREHQSKFDTEFHGWRNNRQTQRDSLGRVTEHQEVVGIDGQHVGTVDKVRGDTVILTKQDQDAGGRHHSFPSAWIKSVDDKVTLSKTADEAHAHWRDAERNSAFWTDDANRGRQGMTTQANAAQAQADRNR